MQCVVSLFTKFFHFIHFFSIDSGKRAQSEPILKRNLFFHLSPQPSTLSKAVTGPREAFLSYTLDSSHEEYLPKCPEPTSWACAGHFLRPSSWETIMTPVCSPLVSKCRQGALVCREVYELNVCGEVLILMSEASGNTEGNIGWGEKWGGWHCLILIFPLKTLRI